MNKYKSSSKKVKLTKNSSTWKFQFYKNLLEIIHLSIKLLNSITELFK
ncbi:Uncharacterised protein [Staphylococcus aureus]|nr:Uncharacterised protein [Staphylococcus aureus]